MTHRSDAGHAGVSPDTATGTPSHVPDRSVHILVGGSMAGAPATMSRTASTVVDEVARNDHASRLFALVEDFASRLRPESASPVRAAARRLQPYAACMSAHLVRDAMAAIEDAPADDVAWEIVRLLTYLFVDAASRSGRFTGTGGDALLALMGCMDEQQHLIGSLTLELVTGMASEGGLLDADLLARIRRVDEEHDLVAQLLAMVSDAANARDDATTNLVVPAVEEYRNSGSTAALVTLRSRIAS